MGYSGKGWDIMKYSTYHYYRTYSGIIGKPIFYLKTGLGARKKPFQIEDKLIQWPKMVEHPGCWSYFGTLRNHGPGRVQTNIFYLKTI